MVCYIYFKIDGRELMINEDDPEDVKIWYFKCGRGEIKKPYWKKKISSQMSNRYIVSNINGKKLLLHRLNYFAWNQSWDINDISKKNLIDHIDQNKTNNHINNLRVVTQSQNKFNTTYKGYSWFKRSKKWKARIKLNGKEKHLGYFEKEEDARKAYLEAKKIYHII